MGSRKTVGLPNPGGAGTKEEEGVDSLDKANLDGRSAQAFPCVGPWRLLAVQEAFSGGPVAPIMQYRRWAVVRFHLGDFRAGLGRRGDVDSSFVP